MLVKSPMKSKKTRKNKRNNSSKKAAQKANKSKKSDERMAGESQDSASFFKIKPWKVILAGIVLGLLGMFYLKHVFATQKLWREVQQVEREYKQVKRLNNSYRLTYDRMIGPAEIYDKAKNKGFINGGPAEKVIKIEK